MSEYIKLFSGKTLPLQGGGQIKVSYLDSYFGKAAFDAYGEIVISEYKNNLVLGGLRFENGLVKGGGPFVTCLMDRVLSSSGFRVATLTDLEEILRHKTLDLVGNYVYPALVLRSSEQTTVYNQFTAQRLHRQINERFSGFQLPAMISLTSLVLENGPTLEGLTFSLKDNAQIIQAPQLAYEHDGKKFIDSDKNGLPIFNEDGKRVFSCIDGGISVLCLDKDLDLDSEGGSFRGSSDNGRIIVVRED